MKISFFDRTVNNLAETSSKKKVGFVAVWALISAVICTTAMLFGAFYQLELKINSTGVAGFDENRNVYIVATVPDKFFNKVEVGYKVVITEGALKGTFDDFHIEEVTPLVAEASVFDAKIVSDTNQMIYPFQEGQKVGVTIIYKRVSVLKVLLTKDI